MAEIRLPMRIGMEAGLSKEQALEILHSHPDVNTLLKHATIIDSNLILVPGFKAELELTVSDGDKKRNKKITKKKMKKGKS